MVTKGSFVFYESYYEKYLQLKDANPKLAAELLEATINYGLYGAYECSKENEAIIAALLTEAVTQMDKNLERYHEKEMITKERKAQDKKLWDIAEMVKAKIKQKEIAAKLQISQGEVSKRIELIRREYPYLLLDETDTDKNKTGTYRF